MRAQHREVEAVAVEGDEVRVQLGALANEGRDQLPIGCHIQEFATWKFHGAVLFGRRVSSPVVATDAVIKSRRAQR